MKNTIFVTALLILPLLFAKPAYAHPPEIEAINSYRAAHGLQPVRLNEQLEISAHMGAYEIKTGIRKWSHAGFVWRIRRYYKSQGHIGENLAKEFGSYDAAFQRWTTSPSHNANLLNPNWCEVGVGQYEDVFVAHFGAPTGGCK